MLIGSRALLGIAGATIAPSTLSLIFAMFEDPKQRATAIGVWVALFALRFLRRVPATGAESPTEEADQASLTPGVPCKRPDGHVPRRLGQPFAGGPAMSSPVRFRTTIFHVTGTKTPETRARRIERSIAALRDWRIG